MGGGVGERGEGGESGRKPVGGVGMESVLGEMLQKDGLGWCRVPFMWTLAGWAP